MSKKEVVAKVIHWLMVPMIPLLALGWWAESDDETYLDSVKAIWRGL